MERKPLAGQLAKLLAEAEFRDKLEENPLPRGAVRAEPYRPNRKQRRAQAAARRKKK